MSKKFIPNGDQDFLSMARPFAAQVVKASDRYHVSAEEAASLTAAVEAFGEAFQTANYGEGRSPVTIRARDVARQEAERWVRDIANRVRANKAVGIADRTALGLRERPARARQTPCPAEPPKLKFLRALHEGGGATPMHELAFSAAGSSARAKPEGAARLELFADMVPPDEEIPNHPAANLGSRPWYLRSFTRSPIVIQPPMPRVPMRIVYWGRWADSVGNVGPFSATAVGWIEGGSHRFLGLGFAGRKSVPVMEDDASTVAGRRERTYVVAVLEEQYRAFHPHAVAGQLPAGAGGNEVRQLEAARGEEAGEAA